MNNCQRIEQVFRALGKLTLTHSELLSALRQSYPATKDFLIADHYKPCAFYRCRGNCRGDFECYRDVSPTNDADTCETSSTACTPSLDLSLKKIDRVECAAKSVSWTRCCKAGSPVGGVLAYLEKPLLQYV